MKLRMGSLEPDLEGVFFIVEAHGNTYMWEDYSKYYEAEEGEILAKWCKWPEEWHPLKPTEECTPEEFKQHTGHDFNITSKRDIVP